MTYSEKLRDPRWQKKRLKILERDGWGCKACSDKTRTLHIHHLKYGKGEPWDVPDQWLETLCEDCHDMREEMDELIGKMVVPTRKIFLALFDVLDILRGEVFRDFVRETLPYAKKALTMNAEQKESPIRGGEPGIEQQPRTESTYHTSSV